MDQAPGRHLVPTGRLSHHPRNQNPCCSHTSHKTMTTWHWPTIDQLTTHKQKAKQEPSPKNAFVKFDKNLNTYLPTAPHKMEFIGAILDRDTGVCMEYHHLIRHPKYKDTWQHSYGKEIGWLAQGMPKRVNGTNIIFFQSRGTCKPARKHHVWMYCLQLS